MTLPLPDPWVDQQSWELERQGVQRNFDTLAQAFPIAAKNLAYDVLLLASTGTKRRVAFGTSAITWPGASANSNITTTTHGLGTTPTVVVATLTATSTANFPNVATFTYTSTTFKVQLQTTDGSTPANTATGTVVWVAIG